MMADFLPPEVLRFLMLRTLPNRPVNFSPEEKSIIKVFNDFDRFHQRTFNDPNISDDDKKIYAYSAVDEPQNYYDANFQIVSTIVQMPHLNLEDHIAEAKGSALSDLDAEHLTRRATSARYWVDNFAEESEKTILQETLPGSAADLTTVQCGFLNRLADALEGADDWTSDALQSLTFEVARTTPLPQGQAFKAIYCVLLNRADGPKAGNLIAFLERDFVVSRFRDVSFDTAAFWDETAIDVDTFNAWRDKNAAKIDSVSAEVADTSAVPGYSTSLVEVTAVLNGSRVHLHRVQADSTDFAG
jgi:lysyl-tRNA synthetase class 1